MADANQMSCGPNFLENIAMLCVASGKTPQIMINAYVQVIFILVLVVGLSYRHYSSALKHLVRQVTDPRDAQELLLRLLMRRGAFMFVICGFLLLCFGVTGNLETKILGAEISTGTPGAALCVLGFLLYVRAGFIRRQTEPLTPQVIPEPAPEGGGSPTT